MKVCCDRCEKIMDLFKYNRFDYFVITVEPFDEKLYLCKECYKKVWEVIRGEQIEKNKN